MGRSGRCLKSFTTSAIWLRFQVKNSSTIPVWILESSNALLDQVDVYYQDSEQRWLKNAYHFKDGFAARSLKHPYHLTPIRFPQNETKTIYIRMAAQSALMSPFKLFSPTEFALKEHFDQTIAGIYYGMILVLIIYNLFIFFSLREWRYFIYILYISAYGISQMALTGMAYQWFWPESPIWNHHAFYFFYGVGLFWSIIFSRSFLNTSERTPRLDKLLWILITLCLFVTLAPWFGGFTISAQLALVLPLWILLVILPVGILCMKQGYRPAKYFVAAWTMFLGGLAYTVLGVMEIVPMSFVTTNSMQMGSALEMIFLAMALADRVNVMKQEREAALKTQLEESQKLVILGDTFRRFVPHDFLDYLGKHSITDVKLGDSVQRDMTILFSDLRSFTTLSEGMSPQENFKFINDYLKMMGPIVRANHGFIDKYIGDAIMALFDQNPDQAVKTGIEMLKQLEKFNQKRVEQNLEPIAIGIGIHTGSLMLGTIGEHGRMESTVISDSVNLASRLEGLTKYYGVSLIISEHTFKELKETGYQYRLLDQVRVKGKSDPVTIYEIFDWELPELVRKKASIGHDFESARKLYQRGQFPLARDLFQTCLDVFPDDYVTQTYIKRCQSNIDHSPPTDWDGITNLENK